MYAPNFDYYRPKSIKEAITLLGKNKDAKLLAGGHSLIPAMKLRASSPSALIDISRIKGLAGIKVGKKDLKIGALTTHAAIAASEDVRALCPILAECAAQIGDIQVRNRGTVGGSLAHADPAADFPTVMVALSAMFTATGASEKRDIVADKFFKDIFTTALKSSEILTQITVPAYGALKGMGSAYLKHRHPASSYAVVGVAAMIGIEDGQCTRVSLVIGGVTGTPTRAEAVEKALTGQAANESNIEYAAAKVGEALADPMSDLYASGEYRVHLAKVMTKRALLQAVGRARE